MTRSRRVRMVALAAGIAWVSLTTSLAQAVVQGPPYERSETFQTSVRDELGTGTASSQAASDKLTGNMSASASATSNAPAGTVATAGYAYPAVGAGGSQGTSYAMMWHTFDVTPGTYTVTARYNSVSASVKASSPRIEPGAGGYGTVGGSGEVDAQMAYYYLDCSGSSCSVISFGFQNEVLIIGSGTHTGSVVLQRRFTADRPGKVQVQTYFQVKAQATGPDASATSSVTGVLASIEVS